MESFADGKIDVLGPVETRADLRALRAVHSR